MTWDEPADCTTERGWLIADDSEHPDGANDYASHCVGNYLQYDNGRGYHVCAYLTVSAYPGFGVSTRHANIPDSARWYATRAEAKAAVERFAATLLGHGQFTLAGVTA
jgi:hypothetical protein